jgi:hypothetical protein
MAMPRFLEKGRKNPRRFISCENGSGKKIHGIISPVQRFQTVNSPRSSIAQNVPPLPSLHKRPSRDNLGGFPVFRDFKMGVFELALRRHSLGMAVSGACTAGDFNPSGFFIFYG